MNGLPQRTTTPRRFEPVADMTEWDRRYAKGWKAGSPTTFLNPITPGATADMERMQLLFQRWVPDRSRVLCVAHADGSNQRCTYQAFESFFDRQRISAQVTIPGWVARVLAVVVPSASGGKLREPVSCRLAALLLVTIQTFLQAKAPLHH